jgi:hypothetical protein
VTSQPDDSRLSSIAVRFESVAHEHERLTENMGEFSEGEWVQAWVARSPPAADDAVAVVERRYERIVNALTEIFDACEAEAARRGSVPSPPREQEDPRRWWREAEDLDIVESAPGSPNRPGRWRRLWLLGYADEDSAARFATLADLRRIFQHGYADLPEDKAEEAWEDVRGLLTDLPAWLEGMVRFVRRLWPEFDPTAARPRG